MKINFNEDQNGHKYVCVNIDLEVPIKEPNYKQQDVSKGAIRMRRVSWRVQASEGIRT